jgi:hypothetical protein
MHRLKQMVNKLPADEGKKVDKTIPRKESVVLTDLEENSSEGPQEIKPQDALHKIKQTLPKSVTKPILRTKNDVRVQKKLHKILKEVKGKREVHRDHRNQISTIFSGTKSKIESILSKKQLVKPNVWVCTRLHVLPVCLKCFDSTNAILVG